MAATNGFALGVEMLLEKGAKVDGKRKKIPGKFCNIEKHLKYFFLIFWLYWNKKKDEIVEMDLRWA